jgi:hypothetical protein
MAMAGLGKPDEIWAWAFHYYVAVRTEYLKIVGLTGTAGTPAGDAEEIAPGITMETYTIE